MNSEPHWWSPAHLPSENGESERLSALVALVGMRQSIDIAYDHQAEWAESRVVWAMRTLQALDGVAEELDALRKMLCAVAVDEAVPLRELSTVLSSAHATARKWATEGQLTPFTRQSRDDEAVPTWALTDDEITDIAKANGLDPKVAQRWNDELT